MPKFGIHVKHCESFNISKGICEEVNKEMDEPSHRVPGCRHREFRHQLDDCNSIAQILKREALAEGKTENEAARIFDQAILACKVHIRDDCKESREVCKRSLPCVEIENEFRQLMKTFRENVTTFLTKT